VGVARPGASGNLLRPKPDGYGLDPRPDPVRDQPTAAEKVRDIAKPVQILKQNQAEWRTASLFSGCGGLDLGFHREGFRTDRAYDLDLSTAEQFQADGAE